MGWGGLRIRTIVEGDGATICPILRFFSKARMLSLKCVLKGSFNDLEIINDKSSHLVLLWEIQGLFLVL